MRPPRQSWQLTVDAINKVLLLVESLEGVKAPVTVTAEARKAVEDLADFVSTAEECEEP